MTIVEFLEARIAEDEARANTLHHADQEYPYRCCATVVGDETCDCGATPNARVLRECVAKRAILAMHPEETGYRGQPQCAQCEGDDWPCMTPRILAAIYADHPDYNQTWGAR